MDGNNWLLGFIKADEPVPNPGGKDNEKPMLDYHGRSEPGGHDAGSRKGGQLKWNLGP